MLVKTGLGDTLDLSLAQQKDQRFIERDQTTQIVQNPVFQLLQIQHRGESRHRLTQQFNFPARGFLFQQLILVRGNVAHQTEHVIIIQTLRFKCNPAFLAIQPQGVQLLADLRLPGSQRLLNVVGHLGHALKDVFHVQPNQFVPAAAVEHIRGRVELHQANVAVLVAFP